MKIFQQKNKVCLSYLKHGSFRRGFTLVEMLVAVSIFVASILALLGILTQSISSTTYAKRKVVASYLAQEGIEYIRNLRDTHVLYSATPQTGWNNFNATLIDASACNLANGCFFNADGLNYADNTQPMIDILLTACSSSTCPNGALLYSSTTGKYGFSGNASGFTRKIRTIAINANETEIISTVSWTQSSGNKSISFSESLFNWVE